MLNEFHPQPPAAEAEKEGSVEQETTANQRETVIFRKHLEILEELDNLYEQLNKDDLSDSDKKVLNQKIDELVDFIRPRSMDSAYFRHDRYRRMSEAITRIELSFLEDNEVRGYFDFHKIWNKFSRKFISPEDADQNHNEAVLFLFSEIFQNTGNQNNKEQLARLIDLNNPKTTRINLAMHKVCQGMKLAEVAGWQYASSINQFGGEADYWIGNSFVHLPPYELPPPEDLNNNKPLIDCIRSVGSWPRWEDYNPNTKKTDVKERCNSQNALNVFQEGDYDVFMAAAHGWSMQEDDLDRISEKVLRPDKQEHHWITNNEFGSIHPYLP